MGNHIRDTFIVVTHNDRGSLGLPDLSPTSNNCKVISTLSRHVCRQPRGQHRSHFTSSATILQFIRACIILFDMESSLREALFISWIYKMVLEGTH